ncbi:murein tripeptide amidase MpaA [Pseudomonadota bacterium]
MQESPGIHWGFARPLYPLGFEASKTHTLTTHNGLESTHRQCYFAPMKNNKRTIMIPRPERGVLRHPPWQYGKSEQNNALNLYGPRIAPVDILLIAAMHGDENETTVVLSEALRRIPPGSIKNPVILSTNPDGALQGTRSNARGVDLNRNWPTANWSNNTVYHRDHGGTVQDIGLSTGESPESEAETQALMDCVKKLQPRTVISLHAPLACVEDPQATALAQWVASQVKLPLVPNVGYPTPGSFGTWAAEQNINIITWELPSESLADMIASHTPVLFKLISGDYESEVF